MVPADTSRTTDLLTRPQAAKYLSVREQTLACWHSSGRYPIPVVKVGRSVRYRRADLDRWLESRTIRHDAE
jgi:excisionase family DNA binding protein